METTTKNATVPKAAKTIPKSKDKPSNCMICEKIIKDPEGKSKGQDSIFSKLMSLARLHNNLFLPDIIGVTETWLNDSIMNNEILPYNYSIYIVKTGALEVAEFYLQFITQFQLNSLPPPQI